MVMLLRSAGRPFSDRAFVWLDRFLLVHQKLQSWARSLVEITWAPPCAAKEIDLFFANSDGRVPVYTVNEVRAGIGALGEGARFAGWTIGARNEINPKFCGILEDHHVGSVVQGDIGLLSTVIDMHECSPRPTVVAAGYNCQLCVAVSSSFDCPGVCSRSFVLSMGKANSASF